MTTRDEGLVYACLTHVPLAIDLPPWVLPILLGAEQRDGAFNLRDLAPAWEHHHPKLGSTAGTFALLNLVRARFPAATRIGICQYRKFVSPRRISGVHDARYRVMDIVPREMVRGERFAAALWPGERSFLVSAPRRFTRVFWHRRGYLKEYARDHCVEDLLRFVAEAAELGVLGRREVEAFLREDVFIPGGAELGVYPAAFWLETTEQIERVVRACVAKHVTVRDAYQARLWSFCAERLGSWLVLKRLRSEVGGGASGLGEWLGRRRWTARHCGQLNLIVDDDHAGYKGGV
ncbi:MAG: hypothetical protein JO090_12605 [Rhizobacter sp.]|nr:hypothetical protein [Rhizobacter sp.]